MDLTSIWHLNSKPSANLLCHPVYPSSKMPWCSAKSNGIVRNVGMVPDMLYQIPGPGTGTPTPAESDLILPLSASSNRPLLIVEGGTGGAVTC